MKPTKCPAKEKKRYKKSEKRGEEHAHAQTSQANINLDPRALLRMTARSQRKHWGRD